MIHLIATDIDDTLWQKEGRKDVRDYLRQAEYVRPYIEQAKKIGVIPMQNTGRSAMEVIEIARMTGIDGISVAEIGQTIVLPLSSPSADNILSSLPKGTPIENHDMWASFPFVYTRQSGKSHVKSIRRYMECMAGSIGRLADAFGDRLYLLGERQNLVTIETELKTGHQLLDFLMKTCPEELRLPSYIDELVQDKSLVALPSRHAVDIRTQYTKGEAFIYVLRICGISACSSLATGNSAHDRDFIELAGYAGCPSNASADLMKYVRHRKNSYVSPQPYEEGFVDILRYFMPQMRGRQ